MSRGIQADGYQAGKWNDLASQRKHSRENVCGTRSEHWIHSWGGGRGSDCGRGIQTPSYKSSRNELSLSGLEVNVGDPTMTDRSGKSVDHNCQKAGSLPVIIKACGSTYIVIALVFGTLVLLTLMPLAFRRTTSPQLLGLCLLGMTFCFLWIASFELTYGEAAIAYRTLFSGTRELALSEIATAYVEVGYDEDSQ